MWTAKRVLILMGGLLVSLSSFAVYSLFFGGIDGLPPLPSEYFRPDYTRIEDPPLPPGTAADWKLSQAFGAGCEELRRPYRLFLPEKGIAFAAGQFDIEQKDGRVRLAPFSVAMFHKTKVPGAYPEISTIRCEVAFLTLDRPVSQVTELTNRKVIKVELQGQRGISIVNNRRTLEKSDDVDIFITNGNLFFEERRNLIWTDGVVRLTDHQTKPPTIVRGKGLEMILAKNSTTSRPKDAKLQPAAKNNDNGGIEQIMLRSDVEMHFWIDARSGFLTGSQSNKPSPAPRPAVAVGEDQLTPDKAHIHIHTGGMFVYDLTKEFAWFESPPISAATRSEAADQLAPDQVHVQRSQLVEGKEKIDQLICDRLDLQFRVKTDAAPANPNSPSGDKEIETAKATTRTGNEVALALDSERMASYGNYLFYQSGDILNGPRTILKGEPLSCVKDGHKMVCKELHLAAANKDGEGQSAEAYGPGQIDMLDSRNQEKPTFPTHVLWRDKLIVVKDKEGNQVFDLMKVYGEASFIDDQQKQELHGEKIYVWLLNSQEDAKKPEASGNVKQELHRVVAQERVRAHSPDFNIRQTNILTMTFQKEFDKKDHLPTVASVSAKPPESASNPPGTAPPAPKEEKKPQAPIDLQANEVTVAISTLGTTKQLQELIGKGDVYVHQAGEKIGEKRVDIQGQLLTLKHAEKGDILVVHGDAKKLARLELGAMIIWGPLVTINQGENRADVDGVGAMQMPSKTKLDGSKNTATNPTKIEVHWKKNMTFDGKNADFKGNVEAFEPNGRSRMLCENLTAILDRTVSFKEGQNKEASPDKQEAQVERILCEKKVFIDDSKVDGENLVHRNILQGHELSTFTNDGPTTLVGPGLVLLLAKGNAGLAPAAPGPQNPMQSPAPEIQAWKLTRVEFPARMWAKTQGNAKNAKFYANPGTLVEVQHFPTTDIKAKMDPDHPPIDGLYLRCELLTVEGRQNGDKTTQYMIAERNAFFRTDKYQGSADIIKYDENTDIVILESLNGNRVRLSQIVNNQLRPMTIITSKVLYNRKTGSMSSEGGQVFENR